MADGPPTDDPAGWRPGVLGEIQVVRPASFEGFAVLDDALEVLRAASSERTRWLVDGAGTGNGPAVAADEVREVFDRALATWPDSLVVHRPVPGSNEELSAALALNRSLPPSEPSIPVADGLALTEALAGGGVVLRRAERHGAGLTQLANDLTTRFEAHVQLLIASGRVPRGSDLLSMGNRLVVVAVEGDARVEVVASDGTEVRDVPAGTWRDVANATGAATDPGGVMLLASLRMPTVADCWRYAVRKAGFWPRFRADLPIDVGAPSPLYGFDDRVDVRTVLRSELSKLIDDDTAHEAMAFWRATLCPVPLPPVVEGGAGQALGGVLPGGAGVVGRIGVDDERVPLAMAGWVIDVARADVDALATVISGGDVADAATDDEAPGLGEMLRRCGLVTVRRERPGRA